ncbi:phosphoglucosamine mutase [Halocatena pleomorpha]|uniref:Phosphoglucosamine mutase n=1 Tax=Halocatena pleomorpha TaxID=1785090 RepID=A0A3P3R7I2_9EURY|nr:phosphoglucosamine mutase [Halocatena pleomorpha]RRJ28590.1 phosphoglucosamine mutase [Halocatena pleomorpha]
MFGTSGIRGPVGEEVTAELALAVGRAVGVDADRIVMGRDARESGTVLADAFAAGVREVGADVVDLSLASTPTVARAVGWYDADAGCSITASHNPPEDNGLKLWQPDGQAFDAELRETIEARVREGVASDLRKWDEQGSYTTADATERHIQTLVDATTLDTQPHVVVDLGNGAGGVTVDALVELGCHVETLNAQPDGRFPGRPSEPTAETLATLCATVSETNADLGVAHDGDADRMMAVDGTGQFVPKDALLGLLAATSTADGDRVAVPVDTSLAVEDHLDAKGVGVEHTPVGDVYVAAAVGDGVPFGGEPSGAWIWPEQTRCPDGPLAACRLVELAAERPIEQRIEEIPRYPIRRTNVETDNKAETMATVRKKVNREYDETAVTTLDGVRVDLGNSWFLIRASGTQPLLRITAEARDEQQAQTALERATELVN